MSACRIYCYTDKNTNKIVYIGKDSHIIFNCDPSTIYNLLKDNNIKLRNKKRTDVRKFEKEIIEMYNIKKYSIRKIATRFKCSDGVISRILRDNNIT